jgi:hypothetical protein
MLHVKWLGNHRNIQQKIMPKLPPQFLGCSIHIVPYLSPRVVLSAAEADSVSNLGHYTTRN